MIEVAQGRDRVHAGPVQRAEEGREEHHLGEDEPTHAPSERHIDTVGVLAGFALADGLLEPDEQRRPQDQHPHDQGILTPTDTVDPLACAQDHEKQAQRGHGRVPRRAGHEVVGRGPMGRRSGHMYSSKPENEWIE